MNGQSWQHTVSCQGKYVVTENVVHYHREQIIVNFNYLFFLLCILSFLANTSVPFLSWQIPQYIDLRSAENQERTDSENFAHYIINIGMVYNHACFTFMIRQHKHQKPRTFILV